MSAPIHVTRHRLARLAALLPVIATGAPAFAQQLGTARPVEVPVIQLIAGLVLCSLAAFAIVAVIKRRAGGGAPALSLLKWKLPRGVAGSNVKVLETHRLSIHADLCRFTSGDREYLVIVSAGAATILKDAPVSTGPAEDQPGGAT